MAAGQQAARITDPVTHGLGLLGIVGGMLIGAVAGAILIAALPVTAPALVVGLAAAAAVGAVAGGGLAGHQLLDGIQRACALPSPATGLIGAVGSFNVRIVNLPAARVIADRALPCNGLFSLNHLPIPPLPPAPIAEGAQTIRINNLLAARVTSKVVCGASIKQGALTVYYGGPTQRVLAVFDLESMLLSVLGFLATASLIAVALLSFPLGFAGMFFLGFGGFIAVNWGLGFLGDRLGAGWRDILQGGFGLVAIVGGAKLGARALEGDQPILGEESPIRTGLPALDEMYAKAPAAKAEIDALARDVADQHGGTVAETPLKSPLRAVQKIEQDYGGDASEIKDLARNTIVVPKGTEDAALQSLLQANPRIVTENVKITDPVSNPLGYSDIKVTVPTESGIPAEIQINSPEMIYAKESPDNARAILGDETYEEIASRPGLPPGGQGHVMYEEYRSLPPGSQERDEIASQSRDYYDAFRSN
jgi:uncharacterized Zn-binding protein involved in type VI secretion